MPRLPSSRHSQCVVFVLALAASAPSFATEATGTVVGISDGDTLTMLDENRQRHRIRLDGIDAPERTQPYGQRARQSLANLAHGRTALVHCPKTDRYGRAVCRVTIDGVDVGLEQIRRGLAWHYVRYANEQGAAERSRYEQAERAARTSGTGLWSNRDPTPPWNYRRAQRGG